MVVVAEGLDRAFERVSSQHFTVFLLSILPSFTFWVVHAGLSLNSEDPGFIGQLTFFFR